MVKAVLLGPPGSGKSTQAAMISARYSIPIVSPGALLREAVRQKTDVGRQAEKELKRGDLVPNHLVDSLVFARMRQADCEKGFVLDGYPRTLEQAQSLDEFIKTTGQQLTKVIHLEVPDAIIIARLSARQQCPKCGAIYNLRYSPPRPGEICYACKTPLRYLSEGILQCEECKIPFVVREDDRPEVIKRRLQIQRRTLGEVVAHYRGFGLLVELDAQRPLKDIFDDIITVLGRQQRQAGGIR